tara:strand:+ start:563 stop:1876 length:1314 start_codon:yes stop_codon:yes gene_type:complete
MVESIRLSLTLVFALHLPLLSWMALFNTSQDCDVAALAHIKIENSYTGDQGGNTLNFDPFDGTKPICIGMLDVAKASADISGLITDQVSSAFAANAYSDDSELLSTLSDLSTIVLRGGLSSEVTDLFPFFRLDGIFATKDSIGILANSILADHVGKNQLGSMPIGVNSTSNSTSNGTQGFYACNEVLQICEPDLFAGYTLGSCVADCTSTNNNPNPKDIQSQLQTIQRLSSQMSYNMCGDFFKTLAPNLASMCKLADGQSCKIGKILSNLSDTCSQLEAAGLIMYAAFGVSYLLVFGVLVGTYGSQTDRRWGIGLLVAYCITFLLFGASFVMYNLEIYAEGADNFFWQPLREGLEGNFGDPIDKYWGGFEKVTVMPDSGYFYLLWILAMNLAVIVVIGVSLSETSQNFGLYKKIGSGAEERKLSSTTVRANANRMLF